MDNKPRIGTSKGNKYQRSLRQSKKDKKHNRPTKQLNNEKPNPTEQEILEGTLKRLHTLGNQKFLSTPYSSHYARWIANIEGILSEFEIHPKIVLDDQYIQERTEILTNVKLQLEEKQKSEASLETKIKTLTYHKSNLEHITNEYATLLSVVKSEQNKEMKRFNKKIEYLHREQEKVARMKNSFFFGLSKRSREQKETEIAQQIVEVQRELELVLLNFKTQKNELLDNFERVREPLLKEIKICQQRISEFDDDGSLEDRWFCCQGLIDCLNTLVQRKAALHYS